MKRVLSWVAAGLLLAMGGSAHAFPQSGHPAMLDPSKAKEKAPDTFRAKFEKEYKYVSDHNGIKGYTGVYILKAAIEKAGKVDRKLVAQTLHGLKIAAAQHPGVIMDVSIDANGDLDRESFLAEARGGKQEIKEILPALAAK